MIICPWNDYVYIFVLGRWFWQHDWLLIGQHEADKLHGVCRERQSEAHVLPHSGSGCRLSPPLLLCILAAELMIRSDSWFAPIHDSLRSMIHSDSWFLFECRHGNGTLYIVVKWNIVYCGHTEYCILHSAYCGHMEYCILLTVDMDINCCYCE